jgi:hypothetical protein
MEFRVTVTRDEASDVRSIAGAEGIEIQETQTEGLDPVTIVLLIGAASAIVKVVTDVIDRWRGGLVIDLRPDADKGISRDREVPYGYVVVRAEDGTATVDVKDAPKDALERWVSLIIEKAMGSVEAVADSAREALGGDKVESEPAPTS